MATVVEALAGVVRPLFGPVGRDVLVVAGAYREAALVTNSSSLVLSTLLGGDDNGTDGSVSNAIGRFMLQHVAQHDNECGDACSALALMTAAGMRHASRACSGLRASERRRKGRLAQTMLWLRKSFISECFEPMLVGCPTAQSPKKDTANSSSNNNSNRAWSTCVPFECIPKCITGMMRTALSGKFERGGVEILCKVLEQWILAKLMPRFEASTSTHSRHLLPALLRRCQQLCDVWPVLHAPGASLSATQILHDEVLISPIFS